MNRLSFAMLSIMLLGASGMALAMDDMNKGAMSQGTMMQQDKMDNGSMMKQDAMMKKDATAKKDMKQKHDRKKTHKADKMKEQKMDGGMDHGSMQPMK